MKNLRYFFEGVFLRVIFFIFKLMPVDMASNIGGAIGRIIGPRLAASRKALKNVSASFPDKNPTEHQAIVKSMWDNLGRVIAEYPHLEQIGRERTTIIGGEILDVQKDSATILITGHLANWEVCPIAAHIQHGYDVTSIYRPPNNKTADTVLMKCRSLGGKLKTIPKALSGTRQIIKTLNDKGHIGILIDQKYNEGVEAQFFNRPAMTSPAFAQLAHKFKCPLVPLKIVRNKGANFTMTILEPLDITGQSETEIIKTSHDLLEEWISETPAQWLWLHRRWKN